MQEILVTLNLWGRLARTTTEKLMVWAITTVSQTWKALHKTCCNHLRLDLYYLIYSLQILKKISVVIELNRYQDKSFGQKVVCLWSIVKKLLLKEEFNILQKNWYLRSTIGERSPKLGVPVVTYHVISQAWRIEIFWVDGRCAKSAPFWILNKSYAHASIYFYQERGLCARNYFQLKTFPRLSRAQWHFSNGNLSFHNSNFERTSLIPDYS